MKDGVLVDEANILKVGADSLKIVINNY